MARDCASESIKAVELGLCWTTAVPTSKHRGKLFKIMSKMPQRPRSHEIETESRRAFASLMPAEWVVREISEEYGVDLEVEIFEDHLATGITFRVQLKSTDKLPKNNQISRGNIKRETLVYWRTLDVPVLVVLYCSPHKSFYARWAHSYDSYYSRQQDTKTITFRFDRRHQLTTGSYRELANQARLVRAIRSRELGSPMPILLAAPHGVQGHAEQRIRARLRLAAAGVPGLVDISTSADAATLTIDNSSIRISLPADIASTTIHLEADTYADDQGLDALVADVMIAIAALYLRIGMTRAAVELYKAFSERSRMVRVPGVVLLFAEDFLSKDYVSDAYDLIEPWIDSHSEEERWVAGLVLIMLFGYQGPGRLRSEQSASRLRRMNSRASVERAQGRLQEAGRTAYSVGELYRGMDDYSAALEAFDAALADDPTYEKRGYFWRAKASVHFYLGNLEDAISDYKHAVACGDSPEASFLLSDVLMRAGRYAEALSVPVRSSAQDYYALGERMNRRVLVAIGEILGIANQNRERLDEEEIGRLAELPDKGVILDALRRSDALDPILWRSLAVSTWESDAETAHIAHVVAADLSRDDPMLWATAACGAIFIERPQEEIEDIVDSGLKWCGPDFLDAVETVCSEGPEETTAKVKEVVYSRADLKPPGIPKVIRIFGPDGSYVVQEVHGK